jgi:hypothetical protein
MLAFAATSTAPTSSGSDVKNCSMPMIVSSSSALRLRPIQLQHGHAAMPFGGKRGRQVCSKAL